MKKQFFYDNRFFNNLATQTDLVKLINEINIILKPPYNNKYYALTEIYYSNLIENNHPFENYEDYENSLKKYLANNNDYDSLQKLCFYSSYLMLDKIKKWIKYPFSLKMILKIHQQVIMNNQGLIRQSDNCIINSKTKEIVYQPPKWIDVIWMLNKMIKNFKKNINSYDKAHQFTLIIKLMFDFLCIHPFSDGNGRVSRLLFYWLVTKYKIINEFWYSISLKIWDNLKEYYASLLQGNKDWGIDEENIVGLINYFKKILEVKNEL